MAWGVHEAVTSLEYRVHEAVTSLEYRVHEAFTWIDKNRKNEKNNDIFDDAHRVGGV